MKKLLENPDLKMVVAAFFTYLANQFDGKVEIVWTIFALIIIDTLTGTWIAFKNNEISSRGFGRSPRKLFAYLTMLLVSRYVDQHLPVKIASPVMDAFLVTTEAVSILENFAKLGYPVPMFLVKRLKNFYEK